MEPASAKKRSAHDMATPPNTGHCILASPVQKSPHSAHTCGFFLGADIVGLLTSLSDGAVRLIPFDNTHIESLRVACAEDTEIWDIYPLSMLGEHFDGSLAFLSMMPNWLRFAAFNNQSLVGMTNFIGAGLQSGVVEIGGTYIAPSVRGTNFNLKMKTLLIEHAFENGIHTIEFKVDTRNGRSMRAVEKLGAARVATLERNMTTWTGYIRDTAVFQLTQANWAKQLSR
jgi:RimJ/RimL family protein N-acetyltransferase